MKTKSLEMKWFSFFSNSFRQIRNFRIRFAKNKKLRQGRSVTTNEKKNWKCFRMKGTTNTNQNTLEL